jgi:hypothetical protein
MIVLQQRQLKPTEWYTLPVHVRASRQFKPFIHWYLHAVYYRVGSEAGRLVPGTLRGGEIA